MEDKQKYGLALAGAGALVLFAAASVNWTDGIWIGTVILMPGAFLLYLTWRKWYCAQCGQYLGQGDRPGRCRRCGSNRATNKDPGVGDAVRVNTDRRR